MVALTSVFLMLPVSGALGQGEPAAPPGILSPQVAGACTPLVDTLRDTVFVVLSPADSQHAPAPVALVPALRTIVGRARPNGLGFMRLGPYTSVIDTPAPASSSKLPPILATMAGEYAFVLHRDGTVSGVRVVAPARVSGLDDAFTKALVAISSPGPGVSVAEGPVYPTSLVDDSIALRLHLSVGHDSSAAAIPLSVRVIPMTHIARRARLGPDNPKPEYPHLRPLVTDTVLVQFAVEPSGRIDMTTVRPIRAFDQIFLDSVLAILPRLRYEPALSGGCPTRTVIVQQFVVRPPAA